MFLNEAEQFYKLLPSGKKLQMRTERDCSFQCIDSLSLCLVVTQPPCSPPPISQSFPPLSLPLSLSLSFLPTHKLVLLSQGLDGWKQRNLKHREFHVKMKEKNGVQRGITENKGEKASAGSGGGKRRDRRSLAPRPGWSKGALCLQLHAVLSSANYFL